ncbi:MAG: endonuclease V, partial [Candidatus Helarchaeota archaeon]
MMFNFNKEKLCKIQELLAEKVVRKLPDNFSLSKIAGFDISYDKKSNSAIAAAIIWDIENDTIIEKEFLYFQARFPYISGFLAFREMPSYYKLLKRLKVKPDLVLVDGHGILHPRKLGLAAHLGVIIKIPTIGVAKSRFIGKADFIPDEPGEYTLIRYENEILGALLKPNRGKNIYVSIGNLIDLENAIKFVYSMIKSDKRLPEPLILADNLSRKKL